MTIPSAFARHVMEAIGQPADNPAMFWSRLQTDYPKSAALVKRHTAKKLNDDVVRDLRKIYDARKSGANRGNRDLNRGSTGNPKGKGKGMGKSPAGGGLQPYEMDSVGAEDMFWATNEDGQQQSARRFATDELTHDSEGFCVASFSNTKKLLGHFYGDQQPFAGACAVLCKKISFDNCQGSLVSGLSSHVTSRYPATVCTPYFASSDGVAVPIECVMFQLGATPITFQDTTHCQEIKGELADAIQISVQIPNLKEAGDFNKDVKENYKKLTCTVLGKMIYADSLPYHTGTVDQQWKKTTVQQHRGFAKVNATQINDAWRQSGHMGVFIRSAGSKEPFEQIHLPVTDTLDGAIAKTRKLGQLAYGVVTTRSGFAIRVKPAEKIAAVKILTPEYADAVGDKLLNLAKGDGHRIHLLGVPRAMNDTLIISNTTLGDWKCVPIGLGPRCTTPGKKNILAIAAGPPPRSTVMFKYGMEACLVQIKPEVRTKQQLSKGWDTVGQEDPIDTPAPAVKANTANSTWAGQAWQPTPRSKPGRPSSSDQPTRPFSAWKSRDDDEQERTHSRLGVPMPQSAGGRPNFNISTPNQGNPHFPRHFLGAWADQQDQEEEQMDETEAGGFEDTVSYAANTAKQTVDSHEDGDDSLDDLFGNSAAAASPTEQSRPAAAGTTGYGKGTEGTTRSIAQRFAQMDVERKAFEAALLKKQQDSDIALVEQRKEFEASIGLMMGKFDDMARDALESQKRTDERMEKAEAATKKRFDQLVSLMQQQVATVAVLPASPVVNLGDHDSDDEPEAKQQRSSTR
jgi:hypothetical protein